MTGITMPAQMAAMLTGGMPVADNAQSMTGEGSFASVFGSMMMHSNGMPDMNMMSAEENPQDAPISELIETLKQICENPDNAQNVQLNIPQQLTPEGANAFVKTLEMLFEAANSQTDSVNTDTSKAIENIWANASVEEKTAWNELLDAVVKETEGADDEKTDEVNPDLLFAVISQVCTKLVLPQQKNEKTDKNKTEGVNIYAAAEMQFLQAEIKPMETNAADNTVSAVMASDFAGGEAAAQINTVQTTKAELQNVDFLESIQNVYEKIGECEPEKLADMISRLSNELKAQITMSENSAENQTIPIASDRQAVMARASKPFEIKTDEKDAFGSLQAASENVQQAAVQNVSVSEISQTTDVNSTDFTAQIIEKIENYQSVSENQNGERELTMKLSPDELGELEIKIKQNSDGIEITFAAQKSESARLIGDKANELAQAVASRGIKIKEMTVTEPIVTHESANNGLEYSDAQTGQNQHGTNQRHFVFGGSDNLPDSTNEAAEANTEGNIINREARLWQSA